MQRVGAATEEGLEVDARTCQGAADATGQPEIAQEAGQTETARACYLEALAALRDTGDIRRSFAPLWGLATLAAAAGDWAPALHLAGATAAIVEAADLSLRAAEEAEMARIRAARSASNGRQAPGRLG